MMPALRTLLLSRFRRHQDRERMVGRGRATRTKIIHLRNDPKIDNLHLLDFIAAHGHAEFDNLIATRGKKLGLNSKEEIYGYIIFRACLDNVNGKTLILKLRNRISDVVNVVEYEGMTPLQCALGECNVGAADALLRCGAALGVKWNGYNLMQFCVLKNSLDGAKFVYGRNLERILEGKQLGDATEDGSNVLLLAAEHAGTKMCDWLVGRGPDIFSVHKKTGASFLHHAAKNKRHGKAIVEYCKALQISRVHSKDKHGETALHYAFKHGNLDVVEALLDYGFSLDLEFEGHNLLHYCILNNSLEGVEFVYSRDSKQIGVGTRLGGDSTALLLAAEHANADVCAWLIDKGLSPFCVQANTEDTFLHFVARNKRFGREIICRLCLRIYGKPNDAFGKTAVQCALKNENFDIADAMIALVCDEKMSSRVNMLHYCIQNNLLEEAKFVHARDHNQMIELRCKRLKLSELTADSEMKEWLVKYCL